MLTNVHEKQTEQLAKKHGRASNQNISFNYLLNGKIVKSQRLAENQNEKCHILPQQIHYSTKNSEKALKSKEKSNILSNKTEKFNKVQADSSLKRRQILNQNRQQEQNIITKTESSFKLKTNQFEDITTLSSIKKTQKLEKFGNGCTTDQCYYQRQLELKVQTLKKERDQLWDSINGIVRENNLLKETLEVINLEKISLLSQNTQTQIKLSVQASFQTGQIELVQQNFQTDQITKISYGFQIELIDNKTANIQTQMSNDQIELIQLRYQKMIKERFELFEFCETLYLQDISEQLSEFLNMKDTLSEYLSIKIDGMIKQFDSQKAMLNKMYEQYIKKFKRNEQELLQRNQKLLIDLQEIKSSNKRLQQTLQILEKKKENVQESNQILNQQLFDAEQQILKYKKQAQLIQQSLICEKRCREQKKKTYSNLLAASHKTISNLMNQMKQFEGLASSKCFKKLKMWEKEL